MVSKSPPWEGAVPERTAEQVSTPPLSCSRVVKIPPPYVGKGRGINLSHRGRKSNKIKPRKGIRNRSLIGKGSEKNARGGE